MLGLPRRLPHGLHRGPEFRLQAELPGRRGPPVPGAKGHEPPLGPPALAEGQVHQLRQVLPVEAQLLLQGDRRRQLQLVQARLPQPRVLLQRPAHRRGVRARAVLGHRRAALLDRQAAAEGQLQEQPPQVAEEEAIGPAEEGQG